jgi:phospholipid/cholesterol/gamma-HCH transport system ATP-binding protein
MPLTIPVPEASPPPPVIEVEGVWRSFGKNTVLQDISVNIPKQRTTAIIGPSGTGKSVLLKHIVGLLTPDRGTIKVFGEDIHAMPRKQLYATRRRMGMLFQAGALFDSMTVGENIGFPLVQHMPELTEAQVRSRVDEKLELVELGGYADRPTSALSGGQRKRVGLARAIIMEPEIVLFDEPNSGLDPITSDAIDQLIHDMKAALGITFVVITHDIVGTVAVADYICVLERGGVAAWGPTAEVLQSTHPMVRAFLSRNLDLDNIHDGVLPLPHARPAGTQ